ncbi:MAG: AAA family ATPase [Actinomycetota bacterium]
MRFSELAGLIRQRPGPVRLVAVDGPGGAGTSTFAARLSAELGEVPVVHTDDFAAADDPIGWWPRMLEQVIDPLATGRRARYQRYDWSTESLAEWVDVDRALAVIIEGVTAGRREWRHHLAFIVWVETPPEERLRRGLARDGDDALPLWEEWGAAEDVHYRNDPTRDHADVVVDGTAPWDDDSFTTVPSER